MKTKLLLMLFCLFAAIAVIPGLAGAAVLINEVELNPASGDQWIELYNDGESLVVLDSWTLYSGEDIEEELMYTFGSVSIDAGGYYVVEDDFNSELGTTNEIVVLKNSGSTVQDIFPRSGSSLGDDNDDDSKTWQRIPNGVDNDADDDWEFAYATKGRSNADADYPYYETNVTVKQGWNLFSVPYILINPTANDIFGARDFYVYGYYPELSGSKWKTWPYTGDPATHDLDELDYGHAYWVYSEEGSDQTVTLKGRLTDGYTTTPPTVSYYSGWNLIGTYGIEPQSKFPMTPASIWSFCKGTSGDTYSINEGVETRSIGSVTLLPTYGFWTFISGSGTYAPGSAYDTTYAGSDPAEADFDRYTN